MLSNIGNINPATFDTGVVLPEHSKIHQGKGYTLAGQTVIAGGGSFGVFVSTTASAHFRVFKVLSDGGDFYASFYENPTVNTSTTVFTPRNNNRNFPDNCPISFTESTFTDNGTFLDIIGGIGNPSSGAYGEGVPVEWDINPNRTYAIIINNMAAGVALTTFNLFMYV